MLLENKNAVIYGAGGSIGGAVARAFAREGARVFWPAGTRATLEAVADEIRAAGGERPRSRRSTRSTRTRSTSTLMRLAAEAAASTSPST